MNVDDRSLTASVKTALDTELSFAPPMLHIQSSAESVIEIAQNAGYTLQQWVALNPEEAIRRAEASLAEWLKIQTQAAIEGSITTADGTFTINKNTTKLIEKRVEAAQKQVDLVNQYAFTAFTNGEKARDHLIRVAYDRAVMRGDTRMLIYLMDRVDGRPGETKVADLDYDNAYNVYQIIHTLFDKQLEVLNSGNGTRLICCSRRSGKTHLCAATLLIEALRTANTQLIYVSETLEQSEIILNTAMNQIIEECQLRDRKGKRLNWRHLDNGSNILVRGLSNTKDPDLIRGHKAKVIVIDEFFHLKGELLNYLVQEVLQPMQMDYAADYKFICVGTPPSIKGTYGEMAWRAWDVPHFSWTYKDNPFPNDVELRDKYVADILAEKGLNFETPYARREFFAEWIYDEDLLLYPEYHTYDPREAIPQFSVDQILFGIDYGVSDNDTLIGIAWDNAARRGYVFHEDKFNRLDIKDRTLSQLEYLKGQIRYAWERALEFFPTLEPREANKRILWDADDNDQHLTDDFNINIRLDTYPQLRLNIMNAHKTDAVFMRDKIRDLLRTAALLLPVGGKTAAECDKTVLKRGPGGQVYPEVDSKVYHPDLLPALRYALWNVIGQENNKK